MTTTDAFLNVALSAIMPGVMAILGVVIALKQAENAPSDREKRWWIGTFMALFVCTVILAFYQQVRLGAQQRVAEDKANAAENRRIGDTQFMKGKLDVISGVMSVFASRGSSDLTGIASVVSKIAKESPEESASRRRAEAQKQLAGLLSEGRKLSDCERVPAQRMATPGELGRLRDWENRAYAAMAATVAPAQLDKFLYATENVSFSGPKGSLSVACQATTMKVDAMQDIMATEFSSATDLQRQQIVQARAEIGEMLGAGKRLYQNYCGSPADTPVPKPVESALADWEGQTLSVIAGKIGPEAMEEWERNDNQFIQKPTTMRQECQHLNGRLFGLENIVRIAARQR